MRIRPSLWFWSLIPIVVLWVIAAGVKMNEIERDLVARANGAMAEAGYDWASVTADVRDLRLAGAPPDAWARRDAIAKLNALSGVRTVTEVPPPATNPDSPQSSPEASPPPPSGATQNDRTGQSGVSSAELATSGGVAIAGNGDATAASPAKSERPPFRLQIEKSGSNLSLHGTVGVEGDRVRIADAVDALMPRSGIDEDLKTGAEAPISWPLAVRFGLEQLAGLKSGRFEINGTDLNIAGDAIDGDSAFRLRVKTETDVPSGFVLSSYQVETPREGPFEWAVERTPANVRLTGAVPTAESRRRLAAEARKLFPGLDIEQDMQLSVTAPRGWEVVAQLALTQARRLASGRASLLDNHYRVTGEVYTADALAALQKASKESLPSGFSGSQQLSIKSGESRLDGAACQQRLNEVIARRPISFPPRSDVIDELSFGQLDQVAYLLRRCASARIEVSGHTDSRGSTVVNRGLSRRRAVAVVKYLVDAGIAADRLNAVGFGEQKPVADNQTAEGRARNRRIEFKLAE